MFGKDTAHCDSSGYVSELREQHITRVALGKAHCVALNSKGHLFTFGLNNKGQCGRPKSKDGGHTATTTEPISTAAGSAGSSNAMDTSAAVAAVVAQSGGFKCDMSNICDFEDHHVDQGQCRVCRFLRTKQGRILNV